MSHHYQARRERSGFTLVELLVVIAIIGVLVALLLPAVQAAREAARRSQCSNHLKQIGLAFHLHHDTYRALPSGGRGADVARTMVNGVPAVTVAQQWNWTYQILPFIEQKNLYDQVNDDVIKATPIKFYFCPSRRPPQVWDVNASGTVGKRAQLDYSGCRGTTNTGTDGALSQANPGGPPISRFETITDGLSNTLLVGERGWPVDWYYKGGGSENDVYRGGYVGGNFKYTNAPGSNAPIRDARGATPFSWALQQLFIYNFGSAHPGGINALVSDGSVRTVTYNVPGSVMLNFARRDDGNSFSVSDLGG